MPQALWSGKSLGTDVRNILMEPYEGLPFDEPKYDLYHLDPSIFTGFARSGRNIIVFQKRHNNQGFRLIKNLWARPQITAIITGEDEAVMKFYFEEIKTFYLRSIDENERLEKIRRMSKSLNKDKELKERFGIVFDLSRCLYETVKDTTNFVWIEKQVVQRTS